MSLACFGTGEGQCGWWGYREIESGRISESGRSTNILFPMEILTDPKPCQLDVKERAFLVKPLALPRKRGWSCLSGHPYGENQWSASGMDKSEYRFPEYVSIRFLWVRSTDPRLSGNRTKDATGGLR